MGENEGSNLQTPELQTYKLCEYSQGQRIETKIISECTPCADKDRSSRANSSAGVLSLPNHDYPYDRPITASFRCRKGPRGHWLRPGAKLPKAREAHCASLKSMLTCTRHHSPFNPS